jgi:hypothetical protein
MEALVRLVATRQEVEETLGMTIYVGGEPSLVHAADAKTSVKRQPAVAAGPRMEYAAYDDGS